MSPARNRKLWFNEKEKKELEEKGKPDSLGLPQTARYMEEGGEQEEQKRFSNLSLKTIL